MNLATLLEQYGDKYIEALFTTWKLTAISFTAAFVIGVVITVMRISPIGPLCIASEIYVQIFRNISGAALLVLLVYALPYLNVLFSYYTCVIIATTLIPSAFCSEYLISGINTIDVGQIEAARALGLTLIQIIRRIVIPQALRSSVLPLTNLLVSTMLTTALASQVPLNPRDLTGLVSHINTHATFGVLAFFVSAFFYSVTAVVIGQIGTRIDRKVRIMR